MQKGCKDLRRQSIASLVSVYRAVGTEKGKFLRYETPEGVPCEEHGIPLGIVTFRAMPPDPEDEEDTSLEPEEVSKDAEGGQS